MMLLLISDVICNSSHMPFTHRANKIAVLPNQFGFDELISVASEGAAPFYLLHDFGYGHRRRTFNQHMNMIGHAIDFDDDAIFFAKFIFQNSMQIQFRCR